VIAARALFVEFCLKLVAEGRATNDALARELMTADLSRVHAMMRGTIADPLTAPEAARMAESIRAVFNVNAKALKLLPTAGPRFSVRQWIEDGADGAKEGSILFISARYVDMSVCAQLLTLWLDTAMNTLMTMPRTRDLKCWFFVDELGHCTACRRSRKACRRRAISAARLSLAFTPMPSSRRSTARTWR
jgi:type IV secretory pathway TraG/TraD family ATPase VirD4